MKKLISILLAILMIFSITTVAFAESGDVNEDVTVTDNADDDSSSIDDVPAWALKVGPKFAKVILKIVKIFVKIAMALGLIDTDEIVDQIASAINGATSAQPEESTVPATVAA